MNELKGNGLLINKIKNEVHMKWLSKAETAVINGSEMTVLPYGYLSQAVGEVVEKLLTEQEGKS